ncbi:MAG: hypothetical protein P1U38_08985 [Aeromicrobium sp.]|uniref:hypothetical protein n=1 Tax=Aeromicrobium sp. TaxID=1871063 RepID=UPI0026090991|nr:hypothetical protein [Aeromicrobium sp.]MDF1704896.1 hypothetical protein [Aeromicrobium sp.]
MTTITNPSEALPTGGASHAGTSSRAAAASLLAILTIAVVSWWLLIDPQWGVLEVYGNQANAAIFWALFVIVCLGFNLESWGFHRLRQPWRGIVFSACVIVGSLGITWALAAGWGQVDPSFAADRPDGTGYFAGAIFVLFAFLTNVPAAANFAHRPWSGFGLRQPLLGLAEIAVAAVVCFGLYATFAAPALSTWAETSPLMSVNTVVGYFYSVVIVILISANQADNWPWTRLTGARIAAWLPTVLLAGAGVYVVLRWLGGLLIGDAARTALGADGVNIFAAQLGVCWVLWSIFWVNYRPDRPTHRSIVADRWIRVAITFALALLTFVVYYRFAAEHVLHESLISTGVAGNALGFIDWVIVWMLLHAVAFERWPVGHATKRP